MLAGGKAERLGEAAGGLPKALVPVGGRPLLAWQIGIVSGLLVGEAHWTPH